MPPCRVLRLFGLALRGFWVWVKCLHTAFSRRPIRKLCLSGNLYRTYSKCVSSQKILSETVFFLKKTIRNRISQGTYPRALRRFWVWVKCLHTAFSRRPIRKLSLSGNLYRTYGKCVSSQKKLSETVFFLKKPIRNRISQGTYPRSLPHKKTYPKRSF